MASDFQAVVGACVVTVSGFVMWRRGMKADKLSTGTATSKIATAAKGFVELTGIARPFGDIPLSDPIARRPCVWFYVATEEKSWLGKKNDWKVVNTLSSNRPFVIEDGTGFCVVSCTEKDVDRQSPEIVKVKSTLRHKIWRLHNGDSLYALGHLIRLSDDELRPEENNERSAVTASGVTAYDRKKKVTENMMGLLKLWKRDQRNLIARFDTDGDGRVDSQEWEKAQATARELAEKKLDAEPKTADSAPPPPKVQLPADPLFNKVTHQLVRPTDGRPLLISKGTEESVTTHNRWRSILGLLLFVGGVVGLGFILSQQ